MIHFNQVSKSYLSHKALDDVSIEFTKGKVTGIVGENGSGKSTTLKLIAGLIRPSKGSVLIDEEPTHRKISRIVAYMSELDQVYPFFTVGETIDYFASQFPDFDRERAEEILVFMKLEKPQKVKHLSKGNRGRLKMAITMSRNAPYILLDEPFSGLDPMVRNSIVKGLIKFVDLEKQALIITTHEIREVEPILDEVVAIRKGNILSHKTVDDIREEGRDVVGWLEHIYESGEGHGA